MRMDWKSLSSTLLLIFMLSMNGIPQSKPKLLYKEKFHGPTCLGCVVTISIIKQLAQVHNSTVEEALKRLCSFFPEERNLKRTCVLIFNLFGPAIIKLMETKMNADEVCYSIHLCPQQAGQPHCHLYPLPKVKLNVAIKESERMAASQIQKTMHGLSDICSLPFLKKLCKKIETSSKSKLPYEDFDGDKFSTFPTLRGYFWRGRDCDDAEASVHPGRRPDNWDAKKDSNCNGIWGVDPKDGIPYEQKFCNGTGSKGIIVLGDSAAAHFHIPPEWITASKMSKKAFSNILEALTNELDWPQFSGTTGFLNSTIGEWTESFYLHLQRRNHCNHRDYQQLSKNGGSSRNVLELAKSLARSQQFDKPAIVIFAMIGNDVCNGKPSRIGQVSSDGLLQQHGSSGGLRAASGTGWDLVGERQRAGSSQWERGTAQRRGSAPTPVGIAATFRKPDTVKDMTRPDQMHTNVKETLRYLDSHLPKGSHVLLTGLAHGHFLWDNLHSRYHPLGQLNKDVTYGQFYSFLSCLQVNPCSGWLSSNSTLRNLTTERAAQLSSVLKEIAISEKYASFDVFYMEYPFKEITEMWQKLGGEAWQLIEPVDGFHPNQIASALEGRILWEKILSEQPHILGKENPFNREITAVFKDQGGH